MNCPFCQSSRLRQLYPAHEGECITSDLRVVPGSSIANQLCEACGFIFNAGGPRGNTEEFYGKTYQLRMHTDNAQNINFSSHGAVPMARAIADFLVEQTGGAETGNILEAGAGKGEFLVQYLQSMPHWRSVAFEPSTAAARLAERLPGTKVIHGGYQDITIHERFDVVASVAVIEHVEQPYEFMLWLRRHMKPAGRMLLTFPDFARNPNDLFCVDHLSKISEPQLRMLARRAGLSVVAIRRVGIAALVSLAWAEPEAQVEPVTAAAEEILARNIETAKGMVAAVGAARAAAAAAGEQFAVFGLGMAGLVAPVLLGFPRSEIAAYVDENPTMQGQMIGERPVVGLQEIAARGIQHISLSVSPIYREQVTAKLRPYGVKVYA